MRRANANVLRKPHLYNGLYFLCGLKQKTASLSQGRSLKGDRRKTGTVHGDDVDLHKTLSLPLCERAENNVFALNYGVGSQL